MTTTLSLLGILILFCIVVGYRLGVGQPADVWTIMIFTFAAIIALQMSYAVTLVIHALLS